MSILAKFDPITNTCGLIETQPARAAECAAAQLDAASHRNARTERATSSTTFRCSPVNDGLQQALQTLVPLTIGITTRHLFVPTAKENWIAYFNNCKIPGSDTNLVRILATQLKVRAVLVVRQDETITKIGDKEWRGFYGAYIFRVYDGEMIPSRSVEMVHYEEGWTFEQSGTPYPFERVDRYSARRKRDRFDGQLLVEYLAAIGLHPYSDDFYHVDTDNPAHLVERLDRDESIRNRIHFFSLEEAQVSRWK